MNQPPFILDHEADGWPVVWMFFNTGKCYWAVTPIPLLLPNEQQEHEVAQA